MLSQGEMVEEFEEMVKKYCGAKYAVAVSSCTAGLYLALRNIVDLWNCRVAIPAFTFPAAQCCAKHFGGEMGIEHIDVNKDTYNVNIENLEKKMHRNRFDSIEAIIPIHQFGLPYDIDEVNRIARECNACVIQDAACAMGSTCDGEPIGKHGTAVFSFHGRKILTTGEGGMVVTDDGELYDKIMEGRQFGRNSHGEFRGEGMNFKMSDLAAAVGCVQMEKLPEILRERAKVASMYNDELTNDRIIKPKIGEGTNWQSYVIRLKDEKIRNRVISELRSMGIEVQIGSYDCSNGHCETSKLLSETTIALPIWPGLSKQNIEMIAHEVETRVEKYGNIR
jgi:dTDP-4-amino-4,6-dideoxygalactose transaminase